MSALAELADLIGKWQGTNHLWLSPEEPVRKSESLAEIKAIAHEQFSEIQYSWADKGRPQEGRIIFGQESQRNVVKAVWFDTWHMVGQFMTCEGSIDANGAVNVQGSYAAPPGPDWGWQITIEPKGKDAFRFQMHNISPAGKRMLAVEVIYSRQS